MHGQNHIKFVVRTCNALNLTYIITTILKFSANMPTYKFTKNITLHSYTNQIIIFHYSSPFLNYKVSCIIAFPSLNLKKFISNSQILNTTECQLISLLPRTTIFLRILTVQWLLLDVDILKEHSASVNSEMVFYRGWHFSFYLDIIPQLQRWQQHSPQKHLYQPTIKHSVKTYNIMWPVPAMNTWKRY